MLQSLLGGGKLNGSVSPLAKVLGDHGCPTHGYRSKSRDGFAAPGPLAAECSGVDKGQAFVRALQFPKSRIRTLVRPSRQAQDQPTIATGLLSTPVWKRQAHS